MKSMIVLCFFIAVAGAVLDEGFKQQLTQVAQSCTSDKTIIESVLKTFAGDWSGGEKIHCPLTCLLAKINFTKENGDLNEDFVINNPPPGQTRERAVAAVEKCKGAKGANECERGFNIAKCLHPELH